MSDLRCQNEHSAYIFRAAALPKLQSVFHEMARILQRFLRIPGVGRGLGTGLRDRRWKNVMNKDSNGTFGIIIGGVVAVIAAIFILSGGELGGKKTIEGDQDLPPVSTADK